MAMINAGLDDLMQDIKQLGDDSEELIDEMMQAGMDAAVECWKDGISKSGHIDTADMLNSVGAQRKKGSTTAVIYPLGKDHKGVRNAEKAYVLHYGTSKKLGDRFVDNIDKNAEIKAMAAMHDVYDEFLKKRNL